MARIRGLRQSPLAVMMFVYFGLITFSIYMVKPAKESLFLQTLSKSRLPYAFLLTAVLMGLAVSLNSRLLRRFNRPFYLTLSLGLFAASGLGFWLFIRSAYPWKWTFLLLYSWGDILMVTSITQFWIYVNDLFSPREVKKRVGYFVSGGLLGGIAGSLVVLFQKRIGLGSESLILAGSLLLVLCILIVLLVQKIPGRWSREEDREQAATKEKVGFVQSLEMIRKNRFLILLSGLILAGIVVSNLVDFQFKAVAEIRFPLKDARTSFLGMFYLGILVFSYLLNVLLTGRILKSFGMRVALLILPVLLLAGSASVFMIPAAGMVAYAVALKGMDKSLTHSLSQSVREVLYIPVPQEIKYKAKVFIDMFLNKFADGLAGLVLIAVSAFIDLTVSDVSLLREVSLITMLFVFVWIWFAFRITKEYVTIVKNNLHIKWRDADRLITDQIDIDLTKLVFDTLHSRERSSVLYAMNLFDLIKRERWSPELRSLVADKGDEIRARSMDALLDIGGECLLPEISDQLEPEALDAQVREIMSLDVYQELIKEQIQKATRDKGSGGETGRMEAAKIIGMIGSRVPARKELRELLRDPSAEVVRYALESAGRLQKREFVPLLVEHLAQPSVREAAAQALGFYGDSIAGTLRDYLSDVQVDIRIRRAVPELLARTGSQRAADVLSMEMAKETTDLEGEIIEALHRLRTNSPDIHIPLKVVHAKTVLLIKKCYLLVLQIQDVRSDRKTEMLAGDLENNLSRTMKQIFELLGLVYPQEDILKAHQNILVGTKKALDYSVELLENVLKRELKELLIPLIEDTTLEEKARISKKMIKAAEKSALT